MVTGSSLVFALFLQPLYGALSDRIGRKPLLIWFGVMGTIGTIPLLYSLQAAKTAIMAFLLIAAAWMIVAGYTHGSSLRQDRPRTHRGRSKDTAEGDGFRTVTSLGMEFTGKYDGLPYPLRGVPIFDHAASHRISEDSITEFYTKDGKVIETDRLDYSIDGNEMVETNSFILPPRPDAVWVWERTDVARLSA